MNEIMAIFAGLILALNEINFLFYEFNSNQCYCGNKKKPKTTFCYPCYSLLPKDMQWALFKKLGDGYEEAYDQAVKYLES